MGVYQCSDRRVGIVFNSIHKSTSCSTKARKSGSILGSITIVSDARCYRVCVEGYRIVSIGCKALVRRGMSGGIRSSYYYTRFEGI